MGLSRVRLIDEFDLLHQDVGENCMGDFMISSEYSTLKITDDDHVFLKSRSTHFRTVDISLEDIESLRFRKATDSKPGYISFHLNDGRVLMARFTENEKNQYRQFFLAVRDVLLSDEDEDDEDAIRESDPLSEETTTILMPAVDPSDDNLPEAAQQQPIPMKQEEPAFARQSIPQKQTVIDSQVQMAVNQPEDETPQAVIPQEKVVMQSPYRANDEMNPDEYSMPVPNPAVKQSVFEKADAQEEQTAETGEQPIKYFNILIMIAFVIGSIYSIFIICFFSGISGSLITKYSLLGDFMNFNRSFISPHALCAVFATVFAGVALLRNQPWTALGSAVLYLVSAILFPPYVFFVIAEAVLSFCGFRQIKKRKQTIEKNYKNHWIWALDALLAALAALAAISLLASSFLDQRAAGNVNGTVSTPVPSATAEPSSIPLESAPASLLSTTEYLSAYTEIQLGDTANIGAGGTSYSTVESLLGTPASKLDSSTADVSSYTCTWYDSTLGENAFFTVTFMNDSAVTKSYSGFSSLNTGDKVTADQYNAVATDGTLPYSQAVSEFGQPDSESETLMDGIDSRYVSWTNVEGDGASFSITFTNNMATDKSSYGLN